MLKMSEEQEEISNSNPYFASIYTLLSSIYHDKNSKSQVNFNKLPYFVTGVSENFEEGSQDTVHTGIYLTSSNNSSLEGNYISGNINAFCQRIKKFMGVNVTPVSVNKFIDIEYCNYESPTAS